MGKHAGAAARFFFALNPAMPNFHRLYKGGQAAIVHATATPYRERSHFDGQDVLESGISKPGVTASGLAQPRARRAGVRRAASIRAAAARSAVGAVTPLVVRGAAPVMSWVPQKLLSASEDHAEPPARSLPAHRSRARLRVAGAHAARFARRHQERRRSDVGGSDSRCAPASRACAPILRKPPAPPRGISRKPMARASARMGFVGWDTHIAEGAMSGQLYNLLGALDGALASIETHLGDAWKETVVAVVTEFGRTARINGTEGTDHGTGTVALLAGGAVEGRPRHRRLAGAEVGEPVRGPRPEPTRPICVPC